MARILIVDDRPANRELLVTLLGYAGHHVWEASDGEAGLTIARAEHPDLIITDIVMPRMDGYEFARQVRADPAINQIQIIFHTSSYIVEETRQLAEACGVSVVIGKPIEPQSFLEQIQSALAMPAVVDIKTQPEKFHHEHMRLLTDTLANKVDELEAEIEERRQAEKKLSESEQRYRALFENSPISIWEEDFSSAKQWLEALKQKGITDLRAYFTAHPSELMDCAATVRIVDANKAALQMYEATSREDMLKGLKHFLHQNSPDSFIEELIAIAQGQPTFHWEGKDRTLNGKPIAVNLNWTVAPGYEDNYLKVIVSIIDVTQRKLDEQAAQQYAAELERRVAERTAELNRTNGELESANRAKDEFLATMSHELRTPLNSILGLSETLLEQRRDPLSDYQQRSLQAINSSGRHLLELINDILDLSKIEAGKFDYYPQLVDVNDLCRSSLAFVKEQATHKSIRLTYRQDTSISKIYADPRRLKQILVNLLTNAVKFTPESGQVFLQVDGDVENDRIQFSVIDNGIGIAPEDLRLLFVPFSQVDSSLNRQYEGTGLGLALVQKLTEMHGGSVDVESEIGRGSRFTVNLPIGTAVQPAAAETAVPLSDGASAEILTAQASVTPPLILLAEDNLANVMTIGDYLEAHGCRVVVAHDGASAIELAESSLPDIILMDIQMPVMDGLEAIRHLRALPRFATTPIIALTALAMSGDRERCLAAGANEYISKPASLKGLVKSINKLLHKEE